MKRRQTPDARPEMKLGPCCICETERRVRTVLMLDFKSAVRGHGWGCFQCGLPSDGAVAVLCDLCTHRFAAGQAALKFVCRGYPAEDGRLPYAERSRMKHEHAMERHPEVQPK